MLTRSANGRPDPGGIFEHDAPITLKKEYAMTEKIEVTEALLIDTIRLVLFYTWDYSGPTI